MSNWKFVWVTLGLLGLVTPNPAPARAHQWGTLHWHRGGPEAVIRVYYAGGLERAVQDALADWDAHTVLSIERVEDPALADIQIVDADLGKNGILGTTGIRSVTEADGVTRHIRQAWIRLNRAYRLPPPAQRRVVAHEFGHAVGLRHNKDARGVMTDGGAEYITSLHDRQDVNEIYRCHPSRC